jgi:hypothetical protein
VGAGNALRSVSNDLPIDRASGFGRLADFENIVNVIRPYNTFLKRSKRSVSPPGRNFNTLYFTLHTLK